MNSKEITKGLRPGTTRITVTFEGLTATASVTVCCQVDLGEQCNRTFKDDTWPEANRAAGRTRGPDDMRNLPVGSTLLLGVPFRSIDPRDTAEPESQKSCLVLRGAEGGNCFPKAVASIKGNKTVAELVLLHCSVRGAGLEHGENLSEYVIGYEDGGKIAVPLNTNHVPLGA